MTAANSSPAREPSFFQRRGNLPRSIDLLVMSVLFLLGMLGFQSAYGGFEYILAGVMALLLGLIIALVGARWRWGVIRIFLLTLGVFLLFGSTFAAPTRTLFGVIPTGGSLWELIKAPVTTWKSMLTIAAPVGSAQSVLGVVWISMLVLSVLGMTCVLRWRGYVLAWMFPFGLLAISVVFGTVEEVAPLLRGVPFAVISLAWLTWRFESARLASARSTIISDTTRPGSWRNPVLRRRVIGGGLIILLSAVGTVSAQALLDPPEGTARYAARDSLVPPFDPNEYVSPLSEFRGYLANTRETDMFTATNVQGGERIRLASMDRYDKHVYNVASSTNPDAPSGAFLRTAAGVDLEEPDGDSVTSTVTVGKYSGVWMPTFGSTTQRVEPLEGSDSIAENLYHNAASQTTVDASRLREGESYDITYEPYVEPTTQERESLTFSELELPEQDLGGGEFKALAEEYVGDAENDYEKMENLTLSIKDVGYFSHGLDDESPSPSGHGLRRINSMLEVEPSFDETSPEQWVEGRIGDAEQYAALNAVMARSVGIPARVVVGFEVPEGEKGTVTVTGGDVTAWVEVHFEGFGWVRFDPTPDEDQTPTEPEETEVDKPRPQVAQPPPPPAEPPTPPPAATSDDTDEEEEDTGSSTWFAYVALGLLPIVILGIVLGVILLVKARRLIRRRDIGPAAQRIDGGWQELLDLRTDLGRPLDPLATRSETARILEEEVPGISAAVLAARADRGVFGPEEMPQAAVDEYWGQIMHSRSALLAAVPWHRRLRGRFSLRSFRRRSSIERRAALQERRLERRREVAEERREASRRRGTPRRDPSGGGLRERLRSAGAAITDRLPRRRGGGRRKDTR